MAALGTVHFVLSYSGTTKFNQASDISVIDVKFKDTDLAISASLTQTAQTAIQYPQFKVRTQTGNAWQDQLSERVVDTISTPTATAKTIECSGRIFKNSGTVVQGDTLPIFLEALPAFRDGMWYNIQVVQDKDGSLQGKVVETQEVELKRQVRLAKCYPGSVIYAEQNELPLSPEEKEIYSDFEAIIYGINGWISRFAKEASLSPPPNVSLYENVAKKVLREQVKQMKSSALETLLKIKEEGNTCTDLSRASSLIDAYANAQVDAIGLEGYATVMRRVLEAFSADKASLYKEKIETMATQFANQFRKTKGASS